MPKIDPFQNRRLRGITETKTFTDPAQPGKPIVVTLGSKPGSSTKLSIETNANMFASQFTGSKAMGIYLEGEQIPITYDTCYCIATIQTLYEGLPEDRYTFEEWAAISETMPDAFNDIILWASGLVGKYQEEDSRDGSPVLPLGSEAVSLNSSAPPVETSSDLRVILK